MATKIHQKKNVFCRTYLVKRQKMETLRQRMNGSSRKKWNLKRFGKWVGERSEKDGDFFENGESFFLLQ